MKQHERCQACADTETELDRVEEELRRMHLKIQRVEEVLPYWASRIKTHLRSGSADQVRLTRELYADVREALDQ